MDENRHVLAEGRYALFESIGSGGMATVYRGHDTRLGVDRAIKVLSPTYASKKKVRARFEAEARTMAVLDHPNIVRVYDVGSNDETAWIVMELIDGPSLLGRIKQKIVGVEEALRITASILEAMTAAHAHGIVHRDIKPHNVLLSKDGTVRITDFGIARSGGTADESFTKTGTVMGTWAFMAPEQRVDAKGVDHTADIYGMGATLFAMATGETPMDLFASDLDPDMLSNVPEALVPLIRKATRYQRDERYPNAQAMLKAVNATHLQFSGSKHPIRTPTPPAVTKSVKIRPNTAPDDVFAKNTVPDPVPSNITYIPSDSNENEREGIDVTATPPPFRPTTSEQPDTQVLPPIQAALKKDRLAMWILLSILLIIAGTIRRAMNSEESSAPIAQGPVVEASNDIEALETPKAPETTPLEPDPVVPLEPLRPEPSTLEPSIPREQRPVAAPPPPVETPEAVAEERSIPTPEVVPVAVPTPVIEHRSQGTVDPNGSLTIAAKILHLRPIDLREYQMTMYYRSSGASQYRTMAMTRDRLTWSTSLLIGPDIESGIEYFLKAKPIDSQNGRLETLKSATNLDPHRVRVTSP